MTDPTGADTPSKRTDISPLWRPLAGLVTIAAIGATVVFASAMFQGKLASTEPITVLTARAGLVMNPGAKVELLGVQVGHVSSIESLPNGQAALHLAVDPQQLHQIPANITIDIAAPTVFGAKQVQLVPPKQPAAERLSPGTVLDAGRVTVEVNTLFQQLTQVLAKINPAKLNETIGAIASAFDGRGRSIGESLANLNTFLGVLEPSLANLSHDLQAAPAVVNSYADAAADLLTTVDKASQIGGTIVDEQHKLDALLISLIGLADIGNDVVGSNAKSLAKLVGLLVPTTTLTNEYHPALTCVLQGMIHIVTTSPPSEVPGVITLSGVQLGRERYRYPANLPKVAARGGPHCADVGLPVVPPNTSVPIVVADDGADPTAYGNQGILANSDALKQWLFGPIDGPPRNSAQVGQPG